jgi:hypothetical protein
MPPKKAGTEQSRNDLKQALASIIKTEPQLKPVEPAKPAPAPKPMPAVASAPVPTPAPKPVQSAAPVQPSKNEGREVPEDVLKKILDV